MATQRFLNVIPTILKHEGGYNLIKEDNGGATNYGISLTYLKSIHKDIDGDGDIDYIDIQKLTEQEAIDIYWNNFWRPFYDQMPAGVGEKVFDVAVNAGSNRAHILLQKALNSLGVKVAIDGAIGNQTIQALHQFTSNQILDSYIKEQCNFYQNLVAAQPKNAIFLKGWLSRANWKPTV